MSLTSVPRLRRRVGRTPRDAAAHQRTAALLGTVPGVAIPVGFVRSRRTVEAEYEPLDGHSLAEAAAVRPFTLAETVFIGVAAARALAGMHALGRTHRDVSPGNIMLTRAGEVMVVDALGDLRERGTPGCVAPEGTGTTEADVYALGATLRAVCDEVALATVKPWTEPLMAPHPGERPTMAQVAVGLDRCHPAMPPASRIVEVASAVRTGAAAARTIRTPDGRWWRVARRARRSVIPVAVILAALTAWMVVPQWLPATAAPSAEQAAMALTEARIDALEAADPDALADLVVPGSDAEAAQAPLVAALREGRVVYRSLDVENIVAEVTEQTETSARVALSYELAAHTVSEDGAQTEVASQQLEVTLVLVLTQRGWRVEQVLPR